MGEVYAVMALRQAVFVVEQNCAYLDADGLDAGALHLLGWSGDRLCAYLRILPPHENVPAQIGRVVVQHAWRGRGLGAELMVRGALAARQMFDAGQILIYAQAHLSDWYATLGYVVSGAVFDEDGIDHVPMIQASEGTWAG